MESAINALKVKGTVNPDIINILNGIRIKERYLQEKLNLIEGLVSKILGSFPDIDKYDEEILICQLQDFGDHIYSIMEHGSQVIKRCFGNNMPEGFNSLQKWIEKPANTCEPKIKLLIQSCHFWYNIIHAIRTEEVHFRMGSVTYEYTPLGVKMLKYRNTRRSPRESQFVVTKDFTFDFSHCRGICEKIREFFLGLIELL